MCKNDAFVAKIASARLTKFFAHFSATLVLNKGGGGGVPRVLNFPKCVYGLKTTFSAKSDIKSPLCSRGAQWARRPDNEKYKIKNKALKNSGR